MKKPIIGIMGSGRDSWEELATPIARWIAESGFHLLTGGGQGVMAAASEAFCGVEGRTGQCIGVLPVTRRVGEREFVPKEGYPNRWVEIAINSAMGSYQTNDADGVNRNFINILTSDVLVALPGSRRSGLSSNASVNSGTRNEVELAVRFGKPIILLGPSAEFDGFPEVVERTETITRVQEFVLAAVKD